MPDSRINSSSSSSTCLAVADAESGTIATNAIKVGYISLIE